MASSKRPDRASRDQRIVTWLKGVSITVASLTVVALCVIASWDNDSSTAVPAPTETERRETVAVLDKSAEAQNVCYGWRLQDGSTVVSVGSNLGDNVAVDKDPGRCPRWVEVIADVTYTSENSELEDSVSVSVDGSESLSALEFDEGLKRLGLDSDAFLDEPGWAICRAAVSLPLLMAEAGHAKPAPVATATPTRQPPPLPDAGSDFARDRIGYLLGAFLLLALTALLVTIGWFQRRHELGALRAPAPAGRTAAASATRKTKAGQRR